MKEMTPSHDKQSLLLDDMKATLRNGGNVTHILNVKISNESSSFIESKLGQVIFKLINHIPITKNVFGINTTITWRSNATIGSSYYHSDNAYIDKYIKKHTEQLLRDIIKSNKLFKETSTKLSFSLTKPLSKQVPLID